MGIDITKPNASVCGMLADLKLAVEEDLLDAGDAEMVEVLADLNEFDEKAQELIVRCWYDNFGDGKESVIEKRKNLRAMVKGGMREKV